jgi:hypothetical protein
MSTDPRSPHHFALGARRLDRFTGNVLAVIAINLLGLSAVSPLKRLVN